MVAIAVVPWAVMMLVALAVSGMVRVRCVRACPCELRRLALAGIVAAAGVLYLHRGAYCLSIAPDGQHRASVRYNRLLLCAGLEQPEVVVERPAVDGAQVVLRRPLRWVRGVPMRLVWHPDGRRVACVERCQDGTSACEVVSLLPARARPVSTDY